MAAEANKVICPMVRAGKFAGGGDGVSLCDAVKDDDHEMLWDRRELPRCRMTGQR